MARRDEVHVRSDHHVIGNAKPAEIIESAVLIDEDIAPDAGIKTPGCIKGWYQYKLVVHLFADEIAE